MELRSFKSLFSHNYNRMKIKKYFQYGVLKNDI